MSDERFTLETAREAAARDDLAEWIYRFLASEGSDNDVLGAVLRDQGLFWIGPVELPISRLNRLAGPPGEPVLVEVDESEWRDDVDELQERVEEGWEPPPVVVTSQLDGLKLEDGNHRVEGLRRTGEEHVWAVVGFPTAAERDQFLASADSLA